jgi:hypothetical protein
LKLEVRQVHLQEFQPPAPPVDATPTPRIEATPLSATPAPPMPITPPPPVGAVPAPEPPRHHSRLGGATVSAMALATGLLGIIDLAGASVRGSA